MPKEFYIYNVIALIVASAISLIFFDKGVLLAVVSGSVIGIINFGLLVFLVKRLAIRGKRMSGLIIWIVKFVVLLFIIYLVIVYLRLDIIPFIIGLTLPVIGVLYSGLKMSGEKG